MSPDLCPFCGSARVYHPCINGQPGDECRCGECGRSWPFKFIEVPPAEVIPNRLVGREVPMRDEPRVVASGKRPAEDQLSYPDTSENQRENSCKGGVEEKSIEAPPAISLPPADGTKPSAHREQDADCGIGGEVCHGESLLHAVGLEMGLSRGGSPLEESGLSILNFSDAQCETGGECGEALPNGSRTGGRPMQLASALIPPLLSNEHSPFEQVPNGGFHPQPGREIGSNREHPGIDNRLQERGIGHSEHMGTTIEEMICAVMRAEERAGR